MDGRVLDPSSPVSQRMAMPNLRQLASEGTNFVRTYAESPQCVPSRASMFTGRFTHEIKAWSNEQGIAVIPSTGKVDPTCKSFYGEARRDDETYCHKENLRSHFVFWNRNSAGSGARSKT